MSPYVVSPSHGIKSHCNARSVKSANQPHWEPATSHTKPNIINAASTIDNAMLLRVPRTHSYINANAIVAPGSKPRLTAAFQPQFTTRRPPAGGSSAALAYVMNTRCRSLFIFLFFTWYPKKKQQPN